MTPSDLAREYVSLVLKGVDITELPDSACVDYVERSYPGGMRALVDRSARIAPRKEPSTPLRRRIDAQNLIGRTLRFKSHLDEVIDTKITEDEIVFVVKTHDVTETSRRVKVNRTGLELRQYKRDGLVWKLRDVLTAWDDEPEYASFVIWGRIHDAQRVASDRWQWDNCYRPGTDQTPMDGPLAVAEMSHADAFGKVTHPGPVQFSHKK